MAEKTFDLPTTVADADYKRRFDELLTNAKRETRSKASAKPDQQHRAFVKAARDAGRDESEESIDQALSRIANTPQPKSVQKRKRGASKRKR